MWLYLVNQILVERLSAFQIQIEKDSVTTELKAVKVFACVHMSIIGTCPIKEFQESEHKRYMLLCHVSRCVLVFKTHQCSRRQLSCKNAGSTITPLLLTGVSALLNPGS